MASVAKEVKAILDRDAFIRRGLSKGLINRTGLARYLKKKIGTETDLDAYISAVRRYPLERSDLQKVESILLGSKITIRNNRAVLTLKKDREVKNLINKLALELDKYWDDSFKLIMGENAIKLVGDAKRLGQVKEKASPQKIIKFEDMIGEIIVTLKGEAQKIPGVTATILNELAINNISLVECITCFPEVIIVLEEKQTPKSYEILHNLTAKQ